MTRDEDSDQVRPRAVVRIAPLFPAEQSPGMTREEVFRGLQDRGTVSAIVSFSGGNDEGNVDSIELFDADGRCVEALEEYFPMLDADEPPRTREQADEDALAGALAAPVWSRYGGFDGDFSVDGELHWDALSENVTISGRESAPRDFDDAL